MKTTVKNYVVSIRAEHMLPFLAGRRWLWSIMANNEPIMPEQRAWTRRGARKACDRHMDQLANLAAIVQIEQFSNITNGLSEILDHLRAER